MTKAFTLSTARAGARCPALMAFVALVLGVVCVAFQPAAAATDAQLTVTKVVVNDNGVTLEVADFPLSVNGVPFDSGVTETFPATGSLSFIEVLKNGDGALDGLDGVRSAVVSPDGAYVYAVAVFDRHLYTGGEVPNVAYAASFAGDCARMG